MQFTHPRGGSQRAATERLLDSCPHPDVASDHWAANQWEPETTDYLANEIRDELEEYDSGIRNLRSYGWPGRESFLKRAIPKLTGWPYAPDDIRGIALVRVIVGKIGPTRLSWEDQRWMAGVLRSVAAYDWTKLVRAEWQAEIINRFSEIYDYGCANPPAAVVPGLIQPGLTAVISGPIKACKTSLSIHLAACLTTGRAFLGRPIGEPRCVGVLTLETPANEWRSRFARAVRKLGGDAIEASARLVVTNCRELTATRAGREELRGYLNARQAAAWILDPLHLICPKATEPGGNGRVLAAMLKPILDTGCAPVLVTHSLKSVEAGQLPDLGDLAGVTVSRFMRSWMILNREKVYAGDGTHDLLALTGTSSGDHARLRIRLDEREWEVAHRPYHESSADTPTITPARNGKRTKPAFLARTGGA